MAPPIKDGVIRFEPDGTITGVYTQKEAIELNITDIKHYDGILVPGFVNTHCHLELSHLFKKIPEKTGLPAFVREIVAQREQPEEIVLSAMKEADEQMFENGIVAVGDISNVLASKTVKENSAIYYHTFVEVFGFDRPSKPIIDNALNICKSFEPLAASIVPHAPYSVSEELFAAIKNVTGFKNILSIHNQETAAENEFFELGTGQFAQMYERLGVQKSACHGNGENSIRYHLPQLPQNNLLLVHNTFSSKQDVDFARQQHGFLFWCICAHANLYIENNLPDIEMLLNEDIKITLGTDSLASNPQLSILAEMQVIQEHKNISFDHLITWATLNGAKFLNIDQRYGTLQVGKRPGINLLNIGPDLKINNHTKVTRLV